jgi:hypothetical protein
MIMSYAKVQPPETCVHEVYLPESTEINGYIGFYVYLSEQRMFIMSWTFSNIQLAGTE